MPEFNGFDPVLAAEKTLETPSADQREGSGRSRNAGKSALTSGQAQRQSRVTSAAFVALGRPDALAFLNSHDDTLGGRPLDMAIASAEGLAAVETMLAARKAQSQ